MKKQEERLINIITDNELSVFDINSLKEFTGKDYVHLRTELRNLLNDGQINSIEKGLYCIRNFRNPYVIANELMADSAIAYWSAMNIHNLTEQIPNTIFSQTTGLKQDKEIFNIRFKFVKIKTDKFFGYEYIGFGNEKFKITDIEKTILDCFDLPRYSGGYEELIRAFAKTELNSKKLLEYGLKMNNLSVLKRLGYLSELFGKTRLKSFQAGVIKHLNQKYTLLDPSGQDTGEFLSKWKIRLNIPADKLLDVVKKIY